MGAYEQLIMAPEPAETIQGRFEQFHALNPWVYTELVFLARQLQTQGHRRIGLKMLFEVIRFNYLRRTVDPSSDFKLNNSMTSRYARLIMDNEADLADAFETRELRAA